MRVGKDVTTYIGQNVEHRSAGERQGWRPQSTSQGDDGGKGTRRRRGGGGVGEGDKDVSHLVITIHTTNKFTKAPSSLPHPPPPLSLSPPPALSLAPSPFLPRITR